MELTQVIMGEIMTEKAERQKGNKVHTLHVHPKATKVDVSNALRRHWGIEPAKIRIIKVPAKTRLIARGKFIQKRDPKKRALVTLEPKSKVFDISNFSS
jgi:ribosomal protein L23